MNQPTPEHLEMLRTAVTNGDPTVKQEFDEVYGAGAAAKVFEADEGPGVVDYVADSVKGAAGGVVAAVENTAEMMQDLVDLPVIAMGDDIKDGEGVSTPWGEIPIALLSYEEAQRREVSNAVFGQFGVEDGIFTDTKTVAGHTTKAVTQFLTNFVGAGKFIKGGNALINSMARGAIADASAFDPSNDRLSNLIEQHPELSNPVTAFLAADPNDTAAEGRLKNALEGLILGGVLDSVVAGFKAYRAGKLAAQAGDEGGIRAALTEAETAADDIATRAQAADGVADDVASATAGDFPGDAVPNIRIDDGTVVPDRLDAAELEELQGRLVMEAAGETPVFSDVGEGVFNFSKWDADEAPVNSIRQVAEVMKEQIEDITDTVTFDRMREGAAARMADVLDMGLEEYTAVMTRAADSAEQMTANMLASEQLMISLGSEITRLAKGMVGRPLVEISTAEKAHLANLMQNMAHLTHAARRIQSASARTTTAGRIRRTAGLNADEMEALINGMTKDDEGFTVLVRRLSNVEGGRAGLREVVAAVQQPSGWARALGVGAEYYINSLLSGLSTQVVNFGSNMVQTLQLPTEKILGGILQGDAAVRDEGIAQLKELVNIRETVLPAVKMMGRALKSGDNILDPHYTALEYTAAIRMEKNGLGDAHDVLATGINFIGETVRLPSRFLMTMDEFVKQTNYRATLKAKLVTDAKRNFPGDTVAQERYVREHFRAGFDPNTGRGLNEQALQEAREATFTQELREGTVGASVNRIVASHPTLRFVSPFIRTPVNILRDVWARTPGLQYLQKEFSDDLAAGGIRAARARGKQAMGVILYAAAADLVFGDSERIRGGGPANPALKAKLMATGWKPYTIKVGDEWVSYRRSDPVAMYFGILADMRDMAAEGSMTDADVVDIGGAAIGALIANLTSKSYLSGFTNFVSALDDPKRDFSFFAKNLAGGFVPNALQQVAGLTGDEDGMYRDTKGTSLLESILLQMKSKIPGWSETIPPRKDWITGEPILRDSTRANPWPISRDKGSLVHDELARMGTSVMGEPQRRIGDLKLTPEQYEKYVDFHANPPGRKSLQEALAAVINNPQYDKDRRYIQDFDYDNQREHPRAKALDDVIGAYREQAKHLLAQQDAGVKEALHKELTEKAERFRGLKQQHRALLRGLVQ